MSPGNMKIARKAAAALVCLLALSCNGGELTPRVSRAGGAVAVERDEAMGETTYVITAAPDCRIAWTIYESELNRGVISHRSACGLSLGEQAPLMGQLLTRVLQEHPEPGRFRTIHWGRILPDGARDTTMAARLAVAAKRSPKWDAARGTPREGGINNAARELANEARIYRELIPVFRKKTLAIELSSVEKVLVLPAGELFFSERLAKEDVRQQDRLPFDFQAWFSIRRAPPAID